MIRCRDAKQWLTHQRGGDPPEEERTALQEHVQHCSACRVIEQHQKQIDALLRTSTPHTHEHARPRPNVSTEQIMVAVQRQQRISRQLEDIRVQQKSRVERMRPMGTAIAALGFFTLASIPLLLLAITIVQTDLVVEALTVFNNVIDFLLVLAQILQAGIILATRNNWLLSGVAFVVVIMMALWLRLMRPPQEVPGV